MSKRQTKRQKQGFASRVKGRRLEEIAAWLHTGPGVVVDRNVRLPSLRGRRSREIDVLLTLTAAGYPIQMAVECKNTRKVGAPEIDAFLGKLEDVGIPPRLGIYISAGDYTSGAIDRAESAGLRTLRLSGLTRDGLEAELVDALSSVVFLVATMGKLTIENDCPAIVHPWQLTLFWDDHGQACGSIPDLLWAKWTLGELPDTIGTQQFELEVPDGWKQMFSGRPVEIRRITVELHIRGLLMSLPGKAARFFLGPANEATAHKVGIRFLPQDQDPAITGQLSQFASEAELARHLASEASVRMTHRVRVPRIILGSVYWPPTPASISRYHELRTAGQGEPSFLDVEGADLAAAFGHYRGYNPADKGTDR